MNAVSEYLLWLALLLTFFFAGVFLGSNLGPWLRSP